MPALPLNADFEIVFESTERSGLSGKVPKFHTRHIVKPEDRGHWETLK